MTPRRQPEKKIESAIVKAVEALGGRVDEFSQRRRGRCVKCGWRIPAGSQQTPGIPDLRVVWEEHNLRLWVEVKAGSNTLSAFQEAWIERELCSGGLAIVAWSVNDVLYSVAQLGVPIDGWWDDDNVTPATLDYLARCQLNRRADVLPASPADDAADSLGIG